MLTPFSLTMGLLTGILWDLSCTNLNAKSIVYHFLVQLYFTVQLALKGTYEMIWIQILSRFISFPPNLLQLLVCNSSVRFFITICLHWVFQLSFYKTTPFLQSYFYWFINIKLNHIITKTSITGINRFENKQLFLGKQTD